MKAFLFKGKNQSHRVNQSHDSESTPKQPDSSRIHYLEKYNSKRAKPI
jgi:hypothetical protein